MKVGFLLDDHLHRPGGIQEHVRGLYRYLEQRGHEAVIFTGGSQYKNDFPERVLQLGMALPLKGSGNWTSVPLTLQSPRALRALMRREACDVLDVQSPYSPTMSGRLLAQSQAAHVMTFLIHVDGQLRLQLLRAAALVQRPALRHFQLRVAVSEIAAKTARALYGGRHYTIIPDAVAIEDFARAAKQPRLAAFDDGRVTILFVGRLEERKGAGHLLRAFAPLEQAHGDNVRLVIAGEGPERQELEALARGLGLRQVDFLGYVARPELPRLLASCDLFCAPATGHESFGRVLIEAMAVGLPIVAYANAGYADTLSRHPGNLLVSPDDQAGLAAALGRFTAQPALRKEVSRQNRIGAHLYSWDAVGARFLQVYEQAHELRLRQS